MDSFKRLFERLLSCSCPVELDNETQDDGGWWPSPRIKVSSRHLIELAKRVEQACTALKYVWTEL
jgi:hypothetical protein